MVRDHDVELTDPGCGAASGKRKDTEKQEKVSQATAAALMAAEGQTRFAGKVFLAPSKAVQKDGVAVGPEGGCAGHCFCTSCRTWWIAM